MCILKISLFEGEEKEEGEGGRKESWVYAEKAERLIEELLQ